MDIYDQDLHHVPRYHALKVKLTSKHKQMLKKLIIEFVMLKDGWLGWAWAELDTQPPPRGELWIALLKMN